VGVPPLVAATGVTRGGKSPSRILPAEGGRIRTSSPQPRSESAGGADRSPEGDPPRRRGQTQESGDAGGRATPDRQPLAVAAMGGKPTRHPDEGAEFTLTTDLSKLARQRNMKQSIKLTYLKKRHALLHQSQRIWLVQMTRTNNHIHI